MLHECGSSCLDVRDLDDLAEIHNRDIVNDAGQTYQSHFALARGPNYILYRDNWLVIAPNSASTESIEKIRESFHAIG
jgi:hypothetical protein